MCAAGFKLWCSHNLHVNNLWQKTSLLCSYADLTPLPVREYQYVHSAFGATRFISSRHHFPSPRHGARTLCAKSRTVFPPLTVFCRTAAGTGPTVHHLLRFETYLQKQQVLFAGWNFCALLSTSEALTTLPSCWQCSTPFCEKSSDLLQWKGHNISFFSCGGLSWTPHSSYIHREPGSSILAHVTFTVQLAGCFSFHCCQISFHSGLVLFLSFLSVDFIQQQIENMLSITTLSFSSQWQMRSFIQNTYTSS